MKNKANNQPKAPYLTYQYRLFPTVEQVATLKRFTRVVCAWYNMALEERKLVYEAEGRTLGRYDQEKNIRDYKGSNRSTPDGKPPRKAAILLAQDVPGICLSGALQELDEAFAAFFRRVKNGETPGYPKFRRSKDHRSLFFRQWVNIHYGRKKDGQRLHVEGIGRLRVRWDRPPDGEPRSATIIEKAGRWYVNITCEIPQSRVLPYADGRMVGIDLGLHHLLATSDGEFCENVHWYRDSQKELRRLQRKLDRQRRANNPQNYNEDGTVKRGGKWVYSRNMRDTELQIKRLHLHIARQREDYINNIAIDLVRRYDVIAMEDLRIKNMVRRGKVEQENGEVHKKKNTLSKSILDAGWGILRLRLSELCGTIIVNGRLEKEQPNGKTLIVVPAFHTSQTCSECGQHFENKIRLSERWVVCDCGMSLDRDHNAAINVLNKAVQSLGTLTRVI